MNAGAYCERITKFGFFLLKSGYALDARAHSVEERGAALRAVQWVRSTDTPLVIANPGGVWDYLRLLKSGDYSYLMRDGAIIQIAFLIEGGHLAGHRLLYLPCPFSVSEHELLSYGGGLADLIEDVYLENVEDQILLRSPLRFDYSPAHAKKWHPASHVTLIDNECRIPIKSPLSFDKFIQFVFENFYLDIWQDEEVSKQFSHPDVVSCLADDDKIRLHFNWHQP